MKNKILKLRSKGKSYREIEKILGCNRGLISYHCGKGRKEKVRDNTKKLRKNNLLIKKVDNFKLKNNRKLSHAVRDFQRRKFGKLLNKSDKYSFNCNDVLKKFGINAKCYLTGEEFNLMTDNGYGLDHIVPPKKGGENTLENMGILNGVVNKMKGDMLMEELLIRCKKILEYNGYKVIKEENN